ncbi:MAG: shikimate kinase [Sphingobacteriaceae bacterium]
MNERIFLTGFMGCGKTTLGRKLASKLEGEFVDLDHLIEAKEGITIGEYFSAYGEDQFRKLESAVLKETPYSSNAIISTGGGVPCFFDNMDWMNEQGITVYIKLPAAVLASRLEQDNNQRPVLQANKGEALIAFIEQKLMAREPFYQRAKLIINGLDLTTDKLMLAISKI